MSGTMPMYMLRACVKEVVVRHGRSWIDVFDCSELPDSVFIAPHVFVFDTAEDRKRVQKEGVEMSAEELRMMLSEERWGDFERYVNVCSSLVDKPGHQTEYVPYVSPYPPNNWSTTTTASSMSWSTTTTAGLMTYPLKQKP